MASVPVSLKEIGDVMDQVLVEMLEAERLVHGPDCEGAEGLRNLLALYRERVLLRLSKE